MRVALREDRRRAADGLRAVGGEGSGEGRISVLGVMEGAMENWWGDADVTVAVGKDAYEDGARVSSPDVAVNRGFQSSTLRLVTSPKRLKSWSPKAGVAAAPVAFKKESIWAKSREGVSRPEVRVELVNDVSPV